MTRHRRKRKKALTKGLIVFFALILITVILISTGVIANIKKKIEMQLYPLRYEDAVISACEEYDMDPAFICAVIYTESKWRANASSSAGAKGLMQLIPETFEYLAGKKGEDVPKDITDPATNIDYGVFYLRYMIDTYSFEDIYTACAAYNAGPGAVSEWLEDSRYSDDGVTLKNIPFEETEKYIQKIKKAEDMYQTLYFD